MQYFQKHTLNEITCDKYLYFYSSRQNGVRYVNLKLAYPKSKLHFFKTLQGQKISCRRQSNITSKQIIRKKCLRLELLWTTTSSLLHSVLHCHFRSSNDRLNNEKKEFYKSVYSGNVEAFKVSKKSEYHRQVHCKILQ